MSAVQPYHSRQTGHAFTLIELLVVIGIIALLAGLIVAGIGGAGRRADIIKTEQVMDTVTRSCALFRENSGYYPLPTGSNADPYPEQSLTSWYPDDPAASWDEQRLFWRLGGDTPSETRKAGRALSTTLQQEADPLSLPANADLLRIRAIFDHMFRAEYFKDTDKERLQAILATVSDEDAADFKQSDSGWEGTTDYPDFHSNGVPTRRGLVKTEMLRQQGLNAKRFCERAYTCLDILELSDIPSAMLDDGRILDAWGVPLIYISSSDEGLSGPRNRLEDSGRVAIKEVITGVLAREGLADRNGDGDITFDDLAVEPAAAVDRNGDDLIDERDWGSHYWNALPDNRMGFLLISAGPDGLHHAVTSNASNEDNLWQRPGDR